MKRLVPLIAIVLVTSCRVGPKYKTPPVPQTPTGFKELTETDQWKYANPKDGELKGQWWEMFGDARLDELEAMVSPSNQSVKQAEAAFRQARALVRFDRAGYFPVISTSPSISASQQPSHGGTIVTGSGTVPSGGAGRVNTFFSLPVGVSWEPDFWGRVGLSVENAAAAAQASAADLENIRLSLQGELAVNYFGLRGTDMTIKLLEATLTAYERTLQLTRDRYEGGVASRADVVQAQAQLESTRAQLTDVRITRAQFEHAIAVLVGRAPADLTIAPADIHGTPPAIPVSLPSQLLERRPDIASAERRVAAANANIGLAKVAYFPSIGLSVNAGFSGTGLSNWFNWPSRFWSVGPSLAQTLFDFGRRRADVEQTEAAYDATVAGYRQTALTAFQEVEDYLSALHHLAQEAVEQEAAVRASEESLQLETERYRGGTVSYLDVITAQVIALGNQRTAVSILERRMTAAVNLIRALGGGWSTGQLPSSREVRSRDTH